MRLAPHSPNARTVARISALLSALSAFAAGCASTTTSGYADGALRVACQARSNGETSSLTATVTPMDKDAERLDLAIGDRLLLRSGERGAALARFTQRTITRNQDVAITHAYEAALPAAPKLELGFARGEGPAKWSEIKLPEAPVLALSGEGANARLTWTPAPAEGVSLDLLVACNAPPTFARPEVAPAVFPRTAFRFEVERDDGGVGVAELLAKAKGPSAHVAANDLATCDDVAVLATRSVNVDLKELGLGGAICWAEQARSIHLTTRAGGPETRKTPGEEPSK